MHTYLWASVKAAGCQVFRGDTSFGGWQCMLSLVVHFSATSFEVWPFCRLHLDNCSWELGNPSCYVCGSVSKPISQLQREESMKYYVFLNCYYSIGNVLLANTSILIGWYIHGWKPCLYLVILSSNNGNVGLLSILFCYLVDMGLNIPRRELSVPRFLKMFLL